MNINYYDENYHHYQSTDERFIPGLGLGGPGSGFGFSPGLGFGGPGFGIGRPFGFGFPFLTGLAAGALLTPRPPYYPYPPYPPYPPCPYPPCPYPSYPYNCCR
ncbi:spore coat protein [Salipaludibacillus keqinensis]|uniref:spore coat protein n=1 Tax=Salipaludibacillus keqinensis TaxID=2045207 RepID=UPI0022B91FCE|nr:spore coat protein [Salipaludibacillus keqinensis]